MRITMPQEAMHWTHTFARQRRPPEAELSARTYLLRSPGGDDAPLFTSRHSPLGALAYDYTLARSPTACRRALVLPIVSGWRRTRNEVS